MNGRKYKYRDDDPKYDYNIHRYKHSKSCCKAQRFTKKQARKNERIKTKIIDEEIE